MRGFNYKKAVQSLNYLAVKNGGVLNKMKAIKLIWLADRLNIRKFGRTITGDEYYALKNGSVPSATRNILESSDFSEDMALDYSSGYIESDRFDYKSIASPNLKVFSKTDIETINIIFDKYKDLDHFALSSLSHQFPEWKKFESALDKKLSSRFSIDISDFFKNVDDGYGLFQDSEESIKISKKVFDERNDLLSSLE